MYNNAKNFLEFEIEKLRDMMKTQDVCDECGNRDLELLEGLLSDYNKKLITVCRRPEYHEFLMGEILWRKEAFEEATKQSLRDWFWIGCLAQEIDEFQSVLNDVSGVN